MGCNLSTEEELELTHPRPRKDVLYGQTIRVNTGCGELYVTVNQDEKGTFEVFLVLGKQGSCMATQLEALGRMISFAMRLGADVKDIIKQLKELQCPTAAWSGGKQVLSCSDAVALGLSQYLHDISLEDTPHG